MDKLSTIKKIMGEILCEMEEGPEDFDARLGKKKPKVEVEVMELKPEKMAMNEDSASDEDEGEEFDSLYDRISEMKRKKRG